MTEKKPKSFLLRIDQELLADVQRWANAEFRSLNGQLEWLIHDGLRRHGQRRSTKRHG